MRPLAILALLAVTTMSGCVAESPGPETNPQPPHDDEVEFATVRGLEVQRPGGWILLYVPFENQSMQELKVRITLHANGALDAPSMWIEPDTVLRLENDTTLLFGPRFNVLEPTETVSFHINTSSATSARYAGILTGFASPEPFSFAFTVKDRTDDEVPVRFGQPRTAIGANTTYQLNPIDDERPLPLTATDDVESRFETKAPGWTHLEIRANRSQPIGYHELSFEFPNGYDRQGTDGYEYGVWAPAFLRRSANDNKLDYYGHFANVEGTNTMRLTNYEASTEKAVLWMHMAGADLTFTGLPFDRFDYRGWDPDR